ncbi:MAG: hypothetical protein EU544_01695 [Promethearchaeota archaeon]|nr:MAG: hypothetical protein EU544_01695 [Candidatus Lokiarchaeota archaeon]
MAWGGSLNKNGTKYYRIIRSVEKTIRCLEDLKPIFEEEEQKTLEKTIQIIVDYIDSLTESAARKEDKE